MIFIEHGLTPNPLSLSFPPPKQNTVSVLMNPQVNNQDYFPIKLHIKNKIKVDDIINNQY